MKELTKEWIDKAEKDYKIAKRESSAVDPVYDGICFHCQQCVEKYLKAILQENDIKFGKIHDLDILLEMLKEIVPELLKFKEEIIKLSDYAVEIRYPGIEATEEEAKNSLQTAEKVREILRKFFGLD